MTIEPASASSSMKLKSKVPRQKLSLHILTANSKPFQVDKREAESFIFFPLLSVKLCKTFALDKQVLLTIHSF